LDTNLAAVEEEWVEDRGLFSINLLRADVEGQIEDLRQILLQNVTVVQWMKL